MWRPNVQSVVPHLQPHACQTATDPTAVDPELDALAGSAPAADGMLFAKNLFDLVCPAVLFAHEWCGFGRRFQQVPTLQHQHQKPVTAMLLPEHELHVSLSPRARTSKTTLNIWIA